MSVRVSMVALAFGLALANPVSASDVGYLYGRVETVDGGTYLGQLRWGDEESFWDDLFNADKAENENLDYLDRETLRHVRRHHGDGWNWLGVYRPRLTHVFAVRFGDLKRIDVRRGDDVIAVCRNGRQMRLDGGSNDVGALITVIDAKLGKHELEWDRIRRIEFLDTPAKLAGKLGEPIYGTVKSGKYEFTGRIQWDNDECLTTDKLDGHTRDGKAHIAFADIASIRKRRGGSLVTLKSGSEMFLTGTNDVNHDNRGVVVTVSWLGSVKIGWDDFDEVIFSTAPSTGSSYADYGDGRDLAGAVVTRDGRDEGRIVFDLDEAWDFELLQGKNGSTEYLIPFRNLARITPRGRGRAVVELRNGLTIELEDGQDVTRRNDGVLVFANGERDPRYVDWADVTEVVFRR